jgi:hypothetical protein
MKSAYRVFAYLIAFEVMVQAAMIAFAVFGLGKWVEDGATVNKSVMEDSNTSFTGVVGFAVHGINGSMIIPLLALVFFVLSFFAKVPGGVKWAGFTLIAVVVQVLLGMFAHALPQLGMLHGLNALILFGVAVTAGQRVGSRSMAAEPQESALA